MIGPFDHPWLGGLFADDAAPELWSAERNLRHMLTVEAAWSRAGAATGFFEEGPALKAVEAIEAAKIDMSALREGTGQDGVVAPSLVRLLKDAAGDAADAVHTGLTSQDVVDTALALTLRETSDLLDDRLDALATELTGLTQRFGATPMDGRTRMQAAKQITVADRIAAWAGPLADHRARLAELRPRTERVQIGGPVGTRAELGDHADAMVAQTADTLGLSPAPIWHTRRDGVAEYAGLLSLISGTLGKMGQDICLMAQQGVGDIALSGGGGSSAMPHKVNPVGGETLVTLARFNAVQISGLHQALVHEQERSGAAWQLEWMILPQMAVATARSLGLATSLCSAITQMGRPES